MPIRTKSTGFVYRQNRHEPKQAQPKHSLKALARMGKLRAVKATN